MTLDDFLNHIGAGGVLGTPEIYRLMDEMSDEARRITCDINNSYHSQEELRVLMSRLLGKPVDETFKMFPPFYTDFGKNITIGRNVFINACCHFQDHGGVTLGDGCLIGHQIAVGRHRAHGKGFDKHRVWVLHSFLLTGIGSAVAGGYL